MPATEQFYRNAKVQRLSRNPNDKTSIVSIYPNEIIDYKPTAFPNEHRVPAAPVGDIVVAVMESASWFREMPDEQPFLEIPISSHLVAAAVINDYCSGLLGYAANSRMPGLFVIPGAHTKETAKKYMDMTSQVTFTEMLTKAQKMQRDWYAELVKLADIDWSRTSGNPLSISNLARQAAEMLGLANDKNWMADISTMQKINCKACGTLVLPNFPVCPNCKAIVDEEKAKVLNIKFAS
jgi:hypothetical protein